MYQYGFYSPFHALSMVFGWVVFIVIVVFLLKALRGNKIEHFMDKAHKHGFGRDSAMDLLRERYVKGEINKEEFETKKKDLSS